MLRNLSVCMIAFWYSIHLIKKEQATEQNFDSLTGVLLLLDFETAMKSKFASQYFKKFLTQRSTKIQSAAK